MGVVVKSMRSNMLIKMQTIDIRSALYTLRRTLAFLSRDLSRDFWFET
jgi:hypothetical protein